MRKPAPQKSTFVSPRDSKLKNIASQLFRYFNTVDKPPADEIQIPIRKIEEDMSATNSFIAKIKFFVNHQGMIFKGKLENEVRVQFQLDEHGKFLPRTLVYI